MYLDSAVAWGINKYLGTFIEKLDANHLDLKLLRTAVDLSDLEIKVSALNDLDLPVQVVHGTVGRFYLKIPLFSPFSSPWIVELDDIILLTEPNQQVQYDPVKEEKNRILEKKKEIQKIEDAKQAEKKEEKVGRSWTDSLTSWGGDATMALMNAFINNVQVTIRNIHIRYEDKITNPKTPFAFGISLSNLAIESANEHWEKTLSTDNLKIYKVMGLEALAVYLNCNANLLGGLQLKDRTAKMKELITMKDKKLDSFEYVLGPINASARLKLFQKPENEDPPFQNPKVHLNLDMGKLFIGINKLQYRNIIALADSMDRMARGVPYRKFRPNVSSYRGHYKEWWQFAYNCILENEVRRRKNNWDWQHMTKYINMCKDYGYLYKKHLTKAPTADEKAKLEECEMLLNITNIVIIRQKIELEKKRLIQHTEKATDKKPSWFSWMWGNSSSPNLQDPNNPVDIGENMSLERSWYNWFYDGHKKHPITKDEPVDFLKKIQSEMTPEEKAQMYKAIGYQENAAPAHYPEAYVFLSLTFLLRELEVELSDADCKVNSVLLTDLRDVMFKIQYRPAANAVKVNVKIDDFTTVGMRQDDFVPKMVTSLTDKKHGLLEVTFETNPQDWNCDQRIHLVAQPLQVVYDAETINKIIEIFKVQSDTALDQLQAAAGSGLTNVKVMTATGLQYAIEKHIRLDLDLDIQAPLVIVPYGGKYTGSENVLIANLGRFKMFSFGKRTSADDVKAMHIQGFGQEDILERMKEHSYDTFKLELTDLQILIAQSDEDWKTAVNQAVISDMHLLNPLSMSITYSKCLIVDDPRLPLSKISGVLPSIDINISEARLMLLACLGTSIPFPPSDIPEPQPLTKKSGSSLMLLKYKEMQESAKNTKKLLPADTDRQEFVQFTTMEANFVMSEFSVSVSQQAEIGKKISELAAFKVKSLECKLRQQTYATTVSLLLGSISLLQNRNKEIPIISTPIAGNGMDEYLFKVQFTQVDVKSPELHSIYKSCETTLSLDFGVLAIVLHQEGLLSLIKFSTDLQDQISVITEDKTKDRIAEISSKRRLSVIGEQVSELQKNVIKAKKKNVPIVVETIKFKLKAELNEVRVVFETDFGSISTCAIRGISSEIFVKDTYTQVNATLQEIQVQDLDKNTIHKMIISKMEGVALTTQILINNQDAALEKPDMDVSVKMGGMRIVFVNRYVTAMLNFLNQFQAAQQKIIEASQAAAQSAKENMKDAYTKATKISLNINIKAPDIIVPVSSTSYDALFIDLGVISLTNTFLTLDFKNDQGFPAVVDELNVSLSELKIARIKLETECECIILDPINAEIVIRRNLSSAWYTAIPDIEIMAKINTIKLLLSQADYQMIMNTLSGNLAEGSADEIASDKNTPSTDTKSVTSQVKAIVNTESVEVEVVSEPAKQEKVHVFLKFAFGMDELIINLFTGGPVSLTKESKCHDVNTLLGRFSLEGLSLKGRILTDQSLVTSVLLVNCLLDDMRKGRGEKLHRLIERTQTEDTSGSPSSSVDTIVPPRSMVDVTFQQKQNDMFADIRIYSFTIILSVDYLLKLADFFNNPNNAPQQQSKGTQTKSAVSVKQDQSKTKVISSVNQAPTTKEAQMTINLKLEKPDIILVEHMDNINTNAMVLNAEILVKLRMAGPHQVINGVIKDLQLYTCSYNPALRAETRGNVLYPVTISLAGSTPQDKGLHVEFLVTDIRLSVSPATIELLNRVLVTMSKSETSEIDTSVDAFNYSDIWNQKPLEEANWWFLKTEGPLCELQDADAVSGETEIQRVPLQELCIISMPSIVLTIEAGVGNKTLPMLMLETCLKGSARNWSSQLSLEASLTVEMGYYNSRLALWEPLIEPVEVVKENSTSKENIFVPWELKLEVSMNEQEEGLDALSSPSESESQTQPVMSIDVISENSLELTVTKTCLEVLQNLGKAFASAMKTESIKHAVTTAAPYKVLNEIGEDITLLLEQGAFEVAEGGSLEDINKSEAVPLQLKSREEASLPVQLSKELLTQSHEKDRFLHIKVNSKNCELALPIVRADKRFFMLNYRGDGHDNWGIISDIKVDEGVTIITLRSILQVYNHFNVPIDVYYMTSKGNELELIGTVKPEAVLNLPLKAVYTPTNELFFSATGYSITCNAFIWKNLQTSLSFTKILQCPQREQFRGKGPLVVKAIGEMHQVYFEHTSRHTMSSVCYNIHLRPAVIFKNCLPINVICCMDELADEFEVKAGDTLHLPNLEPGFHVLVIRIADYLEKEWSCRQDVIAEPEEFSVWTFNSYDSPTKASLDLGMHTLNKNGSLIMSLYCPFWMLNKTGLMLGYRKSKKTEKHEVSRSPAKDSDENLNVQHHPPHFKGPILFSFNPKNFFGKKKASIRVDLGDWSDKFSLDVAGSAGVVICKANDRVYQIGVHNQLTYNTFTKQVTFMPYYVIINNAPFPIECQESDRPADHWLTVEPLSCSPLWPRTELEDKLLRIRAAGTNETCAPFLYTESHNTLLRLNNKYGGINVDIQITEGAVYINLVPYNDGSAPALLINHSDKTITFWEKESVQKRSLNSKSTLLYTWENPSGPRRLLWNRGNDKEVMNDLRRDGCGELKHSDTDRVYWASFLDGMQRVVLFTENKSIAEAAEASNLFEIIQQEINMSINGLGLSLVNNINRQEIMYVGIASSGVIWETCKMNSKRFKPLNSKDSMNVEAAYQQHLNICPSDSEIEYGPVNVDGKIMVDFYLGIMTKPSKRKLRRTFETGLWLQVKSSPSQMQLHAKINRIQIDNQMFDCIFPVVLAPIPPPKSVAADSGLKPFIEISIVELLLKNSQIRQFKYFKVLIQEFHIKVDLGFLNAIFSLLEQSESSDEEEKQLFLTDLKLVDEQLYAHVSDQSTKEQKSFYDLLHFSPLKVHVSFSLAAGSSAGQYQSTPNFLNILMQGIGVTLTDLQDVIFKLAYFERDYNFLTQQQLISEATSHYVGQTVKQFYVLVLGLDVIGNPYGLVLGITKGVEDLFYEPFQGAIQGPGEFAEGLALGMKSLFGHTIGGAAGAVSRITGAMGKGIAALTFDDDFQRKRRDLMNKKPATVQEGMARSGKGLVMGVYSGVTGVFTKPVAGAKEQGVEGFFKGLGKGAVGLVTRPVAGVVDFASGSFDVVKRAAECGEDTVRLRSPRFIQADGLVRPYKKQEADGHKWLNEVHKGKYGKTDVYVAHYDIIEKKEFLMLTDKRIAYICHNDVFGGWQVSWTYTWEELSQPARIVPKGVQITIAERKKKLFGSSDTTKIILVADAKDKEEICLKIESLRGS